MTKLIEAPIVRDSIISLLTKLKDSNKLSAANQACVDDWLANDGEKVDAITDEDQVSFFDTLKPFESQLLPEPINEPSPPARNYDALPPEMKEAKAFLLWRLVQRPGQKKPSKVPYYVNGNMRSGEMEAPEDLNQLATFADAIAAYKSGKWDGIGVAVGKAFPCVVLDFDGCIPEPFEVVGAWTEISQSGEGLHAFYSLGTKPSWTGNNKAGIELYIEKRFIALTAKDAAGAMEPYAGQWDAVGGTKPTAPLKRATASLDPLDCILTKQRVEDARTVIAPMRDKGMHLTGAGDVWHRVALSLCQYGETGEQLFDEFSQGDAEYSKEACLAKIEEKRKAVKSGSGSAIAGANIGLLFKIAAEAGIPNPASERSHSAGAVSFDDSDDEPQSADDLAGMRDRAAADEGPNEFANELTRKELAAMIEAESDFDKLTGEIAKQVTFSSAIDESARLSLRKLIAKKAHVSVASLKEDAKLYNPVDTSRDGDHLRAAREVIKSYGSGNVLEWRSQLWRWDGKGVWRAMQERTVKQKVHDVAGGQKLTASVANSIYDLVKTEAHLPNHLFNNLHKDSISVVNGVLRWASWLPGWILYHHNRDDFRTTQIPVVYDPDATAPRFVLFLQEGFAGTADMQDRISVVEEALGYTLIPSCHLERFLMLIGAGANGKSVLLDTVVALVGREQACAVPPSEFENRFQRAHLDGKLANIVTEMAEGSEIADAQIKSLVSGEMTTAEHKHQPPFDFVPIATHWFGTNHMPHTRDFSDALFRRVIILEFPNTFPEDKQDVHLKTKLITELPGILNMALRGLGRLIEKGAFTSCPSSLERTKEWRMDADQVALFVEEACERDSLAVVESSEVYRKYKEWAMEAGIQRTLGRKNFTQRLIRLGFESSKGAQGVRQIRGLKVKVTCFPSGF